ncbi:MAG: hypothetical protein CMO01_00760 [Thalassobius sp.]|nr:hypothetical protein [Thalassovita sp.]
MTDTTLTFTAPATTTDTAKDCARDLATQIFRQKTIATWRLTVLKEHTDAFFEDLHIENREDYVVFRDTLKAWLRTMAEVQKALKAEMTVEGGDCTAQTLKESGAEIVTTLIEIRRAGKAWSAQRAGAARKAA